jgi:cell wall-associated NlpC family hydrolase
MAPARFERPTAPTLAALVCAACSAACATTGGVPRPFPAPGGATARRAPARPAAPAAPRPSDPAVDPGTDRSATSVFRGSVDGYALAGTALSLRGAPYRNGGSDPNGFDCSGFTQYVFAQYGVSLPRDVRAQFEAGKSIAPEQLTAGDIVFFTTTEPGPSHVAIAIGGDEFVHAPSSTGVVRVEHLSSSYWAARYLGARRVGN